MNSLAIFSQTLYRESHMTNREKLLENDRILDRYSIKNDGLYHYKKARGPICRREKGNSIVMKS